MYAAMLAAEAAANAQKIHNTKDLTGAQMRDGMESLSIDNARLEVLGLTGFSPEITVSCENHGGQGLAAVQQWDAKAKKWSLITDFVASDRSVIDPLIAEDSAAYAKENNIEERCK
jgi:branched-chain amino acid transport system substrate-binding protein